MDLFEVAYGLAVVGGFMLILGVVYPVCAALIYPFYRLFGGRQRFIEYMKSL